MDQNVSNKDGQVSSAGTSDFIGTTMRVATFSGAIYRTILDFNTSAIPDTATINNVTLELTSSTATTQNYNITGISLSTSYADDATRYSVCGNSAANYSDNVSVWNGAGANAIRNITLNSSATQNLSSSLTINSFSVCISSATESNTSKTFHTNESTIEAYQPNLYVDYTEASSDNPPNITSLNTSNNSVMSSLPVDFNFTVHDDSSVSNCTLYTNFNGSWAANVTMYPTTNNSQLYNITISPPNGNYIWNINCTDNATTPQSVFYKDNYTITINASGTLTAGILYPLTAINVTRYQFFNFTAQVNCSTKVCGTLNASLDPLKEEAKTIKEQKPSPIILRLLILLSSIAVIYIISLKTEIENKLILIMALISLTMLLYQLTPSITGFATGSLVPVDTGSPFYTNTSNPMNYTTAACLQNMQAGSSCNVTWYVNATGNGVTREFFAYFNSTNYAITALTPKVNITISLDNTAPYNVTLYSPLNNSQLNNTQSVSFNFTVSDNENATLNCSLFLDGVFNLNISATNGTFTNITVANINYTAHNWSINCSDYSLTNASLTYFFSINDTKPPTITLNNPLNFYNSSNNFINFNFTSIDNKDINISCNLTIDGVVNKTAIAAINGTAYNVTIANFGDGSYLWNATCWDNSSNLNKSSTRNFTVDTVKPTIALNAPVDGYNSSSNTINFNWTATDNLDLSLSCNITIDGQVNASDISSAHNTAANYTIAGFSDGTHKWNISCADAVNTNFSITRNYTVDTTLPVITLLSPANNYNWVSSSSSTATFSYNATDINISACSLIINNALDQSDTSIEINTTNSFTKSLANAVYNWSINCTDWVDNKANSSTSNLTMSYSAPNTGGGGGGGGGDTTVIKTPITKEETKETPKETIEEQKEEIIEIPKPEEKTEEQKEDFFEAILKIEKRDISDKQLKLELEGIMEKFWKTQKYSKIIDPPEFIYNNETNTTEVVYKIMPLNATLFNYSLYINVSKCAALYADMVAFKEDYNFEVLVNDPLFKLSFDEVKEPITITYEVKGEILEYCRKLLMALGIAENIIEPPKPKAIMLSKPTYKDVIRSFRDSFPSSLLMSLPLLVILVAAFAYEEAYAVVEHARRTKARKIRRLASRAIIDLTLAATIIGNIAEFMGILSPYLSVLENIFGVVFATFIIYKVNIPRLILGVKSRLADISIITAYYLIISNIFLGLKFAEINQFFSALVSYLTPAVNMLILLGVVIIAALSLLLAVSADIKKPSLMAILKQEGKPKSILEIAARFMLLLIILLSFSYIAFKPFMEWVSMAVDAPILMVAICMFAFLGLKHHKKLTIKSIIEEPIEREELFYQKFFEEFEFKKKIIFGVSGLLVLNALVDSFVFLLPNDFYLESISIAKHIPATAYMIKELPLVAAISKITLSYAYMLNTVFIFFALALPVVIWHRLATGKKLVFGRGSAALFFSSLFAYILLPVYKIGQLTAEKAIGADIQTRSILYSDFIIKMIIPGQAAFAFVVLISVTAGLAAYLLYKRCSKLASIAMVSISIAFFAAHVYYYISSTWFYALDIGANLAGKAVLEKYTGIIKISLLFIATFFYYTVFFIFIRKIFLSYRQENELKKEHKKHVIKVAEWIHKARKAGLKPRHTKRMLKKAGWPSHIIHHAHRHAEVLKKKTCIDD